MSSRSDASVDGAHWTSDVEREQIGSGDEQVKNSLMKEKLSPDNGNKQTKARRSSRATHQNKKVIESGTSEEDSDTDVESGTNSRKRKIDRKPKGRGKKTRADTDSDEDSSNDSDKKSEVDEYDDDMFLDEEDRRRLEEMTEKDREAEIFKRVEQREILRARHAIQKKIKAQKEDSAGTSKEKKKKKERKREKEAKKKIDDNEDDERSDAEGVAQRPIASPSGADKDAVIGYDEFQRPSEVQKKQKQKNAMADLVNRRKEKQEAAQKKKAQSRKSALDIDEVFGNDGSDNDYEKSSSSSSRTSSESSSRSTSRTRSPSPEKKREVNCLADLSRIRLSRFKIARFVHAPFFNKTVIGCFVRIGIGKNKEGRSVYRAAQILDVVETAKIYQLENTRTNKGFKLKHGKEERVYRLEFVSNSDFTAHEFGKWYDAMKSNNLAILTMDQVEKKEADIQKAVSYNYTDRDIEWMVQEKMKFQKAPLNYALEKGKLNKLKQEAEQYGNVAEVQLLQQQIDELEARASEMERRRSQSIRGISWINQRNRQAIKEAILSGQVQVETSSQDDPFTRKNARMKPVSGRDKVLNQSINDKASATASSIVQDCVSNSHTTIEGGAQKLLSQKGTDSAGVQGVSGPVSDLFNAHNFDVDIDIAIPSAVSSSANGPSFNSIDANSRHLGLTNIRQTTTRITSRPLSLEDYKRRKGLL